MVSLIRETQSLLHLADCYNLYTGPPSVRICNALTSINPIESAQAGPNCISALVVVAFVGFLRFMIG